MEEFLKDDNLKQFSTNQILKTSNDENFENNNLTNIYNNFSEDIDNDLIITSQNDTDINIDNNTDNSANINKNIIPEKINFEDSNTTNCLALTIKEEHKLVAVKNVFIHSLKVTWKVIVSTVALHILKIFF